MEVLERKFECFVPFDLDISKAAEGVEGDDGEWYVYGQVASHRTDYDGEELVPEGIRKGLVTHKELGGHVDWDHQYAKTHDPDALVGVAVDYPVIKGVPYMVTRLFKDNPLAQKIWKALQRGVRMGYSIEGIAKLRDRKNRKKILETEIHRVTIAPSPKGFGDTTIQMGMPALVKALEAEIETESFSLWKAVDYTEPVVTSPLQAGESAAVKNEAEPPMMKAEGGDACNHCGAIEECGSEGMCNGCSRPYDGECKKVDGKCACTEKAMLAGSDASGEPVGIVQDGTTGGAALRKQALVGGDDPRSKRSEDDDSETEKQEKKASCKKCGGKLKDGRCAGCDPVAKALARHGVRQPEAVASLVRKAMA